MAQFSKKYYIFLITFLGLLSAFGPFVTDMYLPTLPAMEQVFHTTTSAVQLGLSMSMVGLAVGQIFFGPMSDKFGRRPILVWSMILFAISTLVSIWSPTIEFFNVCRFLQGLGGSGGIVLSRSIATDSYQGQPLAKAMAIIGAVVGIAPVTAPVIGGLVAGMVGWQGIFWILFGLGLVLLMMCMIFRESLPAERRYTGSIASLLGNFPALLRMKYFVVYILMFGFASGVLFSYVASAPFIIQRHYGFSQMAFSIIFGINAMGIGLGSILCVKFRRLPSAARFGGIMSFVMSALLVVTYFISGNFYIFDILSFFILLSVGYIFTAASTLAMEEGRSHIGAAAAIVGAIGFVFGSIVSPIVGLGNVIETTIFTLTACGAVCAALGIIIGARRN